MQVSTLKWVLKGGVLFYLLASQPTAAQIVPDTTLPNNSIVPPNCTSCDITGGTTVGNNLFHSFEQFSIPTNGTAFFNNAVNIQNIISRVTGGSISNIDGLIRAYGAANVFLLNPNGIIFGPNASLNIGGSFLATTADSINFADGIKFSTVNPQTPPLLTVNVPIGLQFGQAAREIRNEGRLGVTAGKTLALIGGQISLTGGRLRAPGGRIELGSVAANNLVSLTSTNQNWVLGYEGIQNFQDISLSQGAFVTTTGNRGGDIQIQGKRVTLSEGSQVSSVSQTEGQAANLTVRASEVVELAGTDSELSPSGLFNEVEQEATGEGGTLTIETGRLLVRDGAQVSSTTYGAGRGVDLIVRASELVELVGTAPDRAFSSGLFAQLEEGATGEGGNLTIDTRRLIVQDGAQVSSATFGQNRAGDISVRASQSVELIGSAVNLLNQDIISSGLFAQVEEEATGNAGNLVLETGQLTVLGGAQVSTSTRSAGSGGTLTIKADSINLSGASPEATRNIGRSGIFVSAEQGATGNAGELNITTGQLTVENRAEISANNSGPGNGGTATINARQLIVRDGGEVRARSFAQGPGGNLIINAAESVEVGGSGTIGSETFPSALSTSAETSAFGKAGNLRITTNDLKVQDGAEVTVSSQGTGQAGNLEITSRSIKLDNQGKLIGETASADGGNITLNLRDLLQLRRNSQISTNAGTEQQGGNGGNITINVPNGFIVTVPNENSDITANAFSGSGGKITINSLDNFGIQQRSREDLVRELQTNDPDLLKPERLRTNDITAFSLTSPTLEGQVIINTPDVDPSKGFVELPTVLADTLELIADTNCAAVASTDADTEKSKFTITGRGGLPPSPNEPLSTDVVWSDTRIPTISKEQRSETPAVKPPSKVETLKVVPATGWVFNGKGQVTLISHASNANSVGTTPAACPKQ